MTATRIAPHSGASLWTAADLTPADYMLPLGTEAAAELQAALASPGSVADAMALPSLSPLLRQVAERLEHGRGFVLLRGLALEGAEAEAALLLLAGHLGNVLPQNASGSLLTRPVAPPPAVGDAPRFHADLADAVGLLSTAPTTLTLFSAAALHNILLQSQREMLAVLYQSLPHAGPDGERIELPVFALAGGAFVARYDRESIHDAELLPEQRSALAALELAATKPGLAVTLQLHAGDLLFHNPHVVWRRQQWVAESPPLLRLWLAMPNSRPLPEAFRPLFGETAGGVLRGGAMALSRRMRG
jgi:hypothetical protein